VESPLALDLEATLRPLAAGDELECHPSLPEPRAPSGVAQDWAAAPAFFMEVVLTAWNLWKYEALRKFGLELVPKYLAAEFLLVLYLEGMYLASAA
jgi:hypothetical protein